MPLAAGGGGGVHVRGLPAHEGTDGSSEKSLPVSLLSRQKSVLCWLSQLGTERADTTQIATCPDFSAHTPTPRPNLGLILASAAKHGANVLETRPFTQPRAATALGPSRGPMVSVLTPFSQMKDQEERTVQATSQRSGCSGARDYQLLQGPFLLYSSTSYRL